MSRVCATILLLASTGTLFYGETRSTEVRARLTFANGYCDQFAHVELVGPKGVVAEGTPDENCEIVFTDVAPGTYQLKASGNNFSDTDSVVTPSPWTEQFPLTVAAPAAEYKADPAMSAYVSVKDLSVPPRAKKDFSKANALAERQQFDKAIQLLNHALASYPAFANAYNSLGVIYGWLGEPDREREALEKALAIDNHFVLAFMNLGRLSIRAGNYKEAEDPLYKAAALVPTDPAPLLLLAISQLGAGNTAEVIATSQRAHALHAPHAFVHKLAARAYEDQKQTANAIGELQTFLKEEPTGNRADDVRKQLQLLRTTGSTVHQALTADPAS